MTDEERTHIIEVALNKLRNHTHIEVLNTSYIRQGENGLEHNSYENVKTVTFQVYDPFSSFSQSLTVTIQNEEL
jgi:hypothetical protein